MTRRYVQAVLYGGLPDTGTKKEVAKWNTLHLVKELLEGK